MSGNRVQPSTRIRQDAAAVDVSDHLQKGVLDDVLRRLGVVQHRQRKTVEAVGVFVEKLTHDRVARSGRRDR